MSTPFMSVSPWILHTCLMCPCRAFYECFFSFFLFFSVRYLGFRIFWGYLGLKRPLIFGERKKKKHRQRLANGTLNTCAKFQGLTLKSGLEIWTFVWLSAKITPWHRCYLVLVYIRSWELSLTYYWSYAISSSNVWAKLCTKMPWSTWKRLAQKIYW